jgi:cellulose synthase (UDP-forming)
VHGTFQSFKVLPTVLMTLAKPFGHAFRVTPKGARANASDFDRPIFWTASSLMVLTIVGLVINAQPEWRIIDQAGLLPVVACWAAINIVVLFLVCMMSLQGPVRRGEERFNIDEPIWMFAANGALSTGRIKDISLSGVAIVADDDRARAMKNGEPANIFIAEVGFVTATVVRAERRFLAVNFDLPASTERDLLIRKLFTAGLDATTVDASALSSMTAMLMSIWAKATTNAKIAVAPATLAASPESEKLPARSLLVAPQTPPMVLAMLAAERSIAA